MEFARLAEVYEKLEKTSSGNAMREILAHFFATVPPEEIGLVAYLTLGKIASEYDEVNLGIADKSVLKSLAAAAGTELSRVQKIMWEAGDVGTTAEKILQQKPRTLVPVGTLTIHELFEKLQRLAASSGIGSQDAKSNLLITLLQKASPREARYLLRIVLGTLRLGVGDMAVLDALALAYTGDKKNKGKLESAYNICPDVGIIAETISRKGLKGIEKIEVQVGRPIKMMLAQRIDSLEEISAKMPGEVTVEGKYDGERIQAHKNQKGKISLFSRRLENITPQFPEVVKYLEKYVEAREFVVEGEVIAVNEAGKPLPFQTLMQRRRKYEVGEYIKKIPVQIKLFDVLYCNGKSFLTEPFSTRTEKLEKIVQKNKQVVLTDSIITNKVEKINAFFQKMLEAGYEGIMIKSRAQDSIYQAGTRGWNWIKWKREYVKEMQDTFDVVIVGAYHGKGKRAGKYGALLGAAYNPLQDQFETLCKLGTGLTDEVLAELPRKLSKYKISKKPARLIIKKEMVPEVWFEPVLVVEVLGAELTQSPFHTCGSGIALRFPRFLRFREDKTAEQATTTKEIEGMFKKK